MPRRRVMFQTVVTTVTYVDLPDGELSPEQITRAAEDQVDLPSLCNHCETVIDWVDAWTPSAVDGRLIR